MSSFAVPGAELGMELSDENGRAVVQLHGLTSSRARDRLLHMDLGRGLSGTRLLRYDARAHGRSTGRAVPEDYRWDNLADDLLRLLDHVFPGERVHGVGPSMGAGTLLHAAVRDPERFSGLTLMVPATAWATRARIAGRYVEAASVIEREGMETYLEAGRDVVPPPATAGVPVTVPEIADDLMPSVLRGAAQSDLPSPDAIAGLTLPVTLLAWTADVSHPLSTARALHELLPGSSLTIASTPADLDDWPRVLARDVARDDARAARQATAQDASRR